MSSTGKSQKKSYVWSYFKDCGSSKAKCTFCSKTFSFKGGSTFNLNRHLKSQHPKISMRESGSTVAASSTFKSSEIEFEVIPVPTIQMEKSQPGRFSQGSVQLHPAMSYFHRPMSNEKKDDINHLLVTAMIKNLLPFELVENIYIKKLFLELNPSYQLPSHKTISAVHIPQLYAEVKEKVKESLLTTTAVCLTTEGWTSVSNESYIAVTVHYISQDFKKASNFLDCYHYQDSHTVDHLADELKRVCDEWGISNRVIAVVSDNAANIVAAIRKTGWPHFSCFAHTLNLIVQKAIEEITDVRSKIKTIVEFFKGSPQALEKLKETQVQMNYPILELKQDAVTQWDSSYDMFLRVRELREPLLSTLAVYYPNLCLLTTPDIQIIEDVCEMLGIFKGIIDEISSEKFLTASKLILLTNILINHCLNFKSTSSMPEPIEKMCEKLIDGLHKRFNNIEENKIFALATLLDPRYKKYGFQGVNNFECAKRHLLSLVNNIPNLNLVKIEAIENSLQPSSHWKLFDEKVQNMISTPDSFAAATIEIDKYLQEPLLPRLEDPFLWWDDRHKVYPQLVSVVKKYLCIVGTSTPSEMISKTGQTLTEKRNQLKGDKVAQLLFLNVNL